MDARWLWLSKSVGSKRVPLELIAACAIVMAGAILQGSVGFGLGMLAAPLLVLIDPSLVPAPLLLAALALTLLVAFSERASIDLKGIGWALIGRVPGTFIGAATLAVASQDATTVLVGIIVFVAIGLIGSGVNLSRTPRVLFFAGTLSGFMGTTTSIGGPPIAALYHNAPGAEIRGTMASFFVVSLVVTLSALAFVGRLGLDELYAGAFLLPGVLAGFAISRRIAPILDRGYTRAAVLTVSALAGLSVIVQVLVKSS